MSTPATPFPKHIERHIGPGARFGRVLAYLRQDKPIRTGHQDFALDEARQLVADLAAAIAYVEAAEAAP